MRLFFSNLAVTATLLASAASSVAQDIPTDLPVADLLTSAQSHLAKRETTEALAYFDAAIAKDPSNYLSLFKRATTYLSLGRSAQASQDFNKVLELKPGFEGAHLQLAKIKSKAADWEGARADYVAARRGQDSTELLELAEAEGAAELAVAAEKGQKWDECVSHAGVAILVASRAAHLREVRSRCRFERGELEEGMGDLHHVLHLKPGNTDPHVVISATSFYGLGDLENGLAQIRKCLHSDPDSKICNGLYKQQKRVQKAMSKIEGQLKRGQTTTAGRALVGTSEEPGLLPTVQEQIDELRQSGKIPAKANARLYDVLVDMVCQAYSESNHKNAAKYCEQAIQADAQSFWGLVYQAKSLMKREDYETAISTLEKAAEAHPDKRDKINPILNKAQVALKRSKSKDYYKVLGVATDADEKQIKSAYRKASRKYHPDKAAKLGLTREEAEKKMSALHEAYEVLSNPELRARFDQGDDPNSQERGSPFQGTPFGGGQQFMFQQGGANFKFHFPGGGGGPFGF